VQPEGDKLRVTLFGREGRTLGTFAIRLRLDEAWFEVSIVEIDDSVPSLVFPTPLESESLVIPQNVGRWIRKPIPTRQWWLYPVHINMRWFGGLRGNHGWIGILEEGATDGGILATELSASPAWLRTMGKWGNLPRTVRYHFIEGNYVHLAKVYRAYAKEKGMLATLKEKIAAHPTVENLRGGRILSFMLAQTNRPDRYEDVYKPVPNDSTADGLQIEYTFAEAIKIVEEARKLGFERGIINVRGWIKGGYDESHPDIFPIEAALGTEDELRDLLTADDPIVSVLHDNYQDIYPQSASFPTGVIRNKAGNLLTGGWWAGGQSYILTARIAVENARRNWSELATFNPRGMMIDTTSAVQLYENYEVGEEHTRAEDMHYKKDLLAFFRERQDIVGSEESSDWGVPYVDWLENRHRRIQGVSVPLWGLVFHDCAYCSRYRDQSGESLAPTWLTDMLWGYALTFWARASHTWEETIPEFKATYHVDEWHYKIGLDEMIHHAFLTDDGAVEQSVFEHGTITVNFSPEPRTVNGVTVAGYGYVIEEHEV
jgi:hypothetical protein